VALTKPDVLRVLPFNSAASTSWLSPAQFGDTIVWDGQRCVDTRVITRTRRVASTRC
jgi:hypothetical protein